MTKLAAVLLAASLFSSPLLATAQPAAAEPQAGLFLRVAEDALEPGAAAVPPVVPVAEFETEQLPRSASPVAEPGTWALLGLGIIGLGLARRRLATGDRSATGRSATSRSDGARPVPTVSSRP